MATLDNDDIKAIAKETAKFLKEEKQDFWIPGEQHYLDHVWLREFRKEIEKRADGKTSRKEMILGALSWMGILYGIWFLGYSALKSGKEFLEFVFTNPPIGG